MGQFWEYDPLLSEVDPTATFSKPLPGEPRITIGGRKADDGVSSFWESDPEARQPRTLPQELGRQLGLTARYGMEGLASVPAMAGDAANALVNIPLNAMGLKPLMPVSQAIGQTLDAAGAPKPENGLERVVGETSKAMASIPGFSELARLSNVKALKPLLDDLGTQFAAAGIFGGTTSGLKELGAPDSVSLPAGVAMAALPALRGQPSPDMAARLADFQKSGIKPSLPDVTQSPFWQRLMNVVKEVPLASGVVKSNETARLGQAETSAKNIAAGYGRPTSAQSLGENVQQAVGDYRFGERPSGMTASQVMTAPTRASSITAKADVLYSRVPINPTQSIDIPNTKIAIQNAGMKFANPELSGEFASPMMERLGNIIERAGDAVTWSDLRQLRTELRYLRGKAVIDPSVDDRALAQIDDAITHDMFSGARQHGGNAAAQAVARADQYYAAAMQQVTSKLKSIYGTDRPEAVFAQIKNALSAAPNKSDLGKLKQLTRVLSKEEWGDVASTVIDDLGKPTPGAVGAANAPSFSIAQFVTRFNQMSPEARTLLFDRAGKGDLRDALEALSRTLSNMKATDKLANVSQSGNQLIAGGALTMAVFHPVKTAAILMAANFSARAMYNPTFIRLMTKTIKTLNASGAEQTAAQVVRFANQNPALAADAQTLLGALVPVRAEQNQ